MDNHNMSEKSKLELSHELYSENQRKQFYAEFQAALDAEQATFQALNDHWQSNPAKWKFWKRPPVEWKQTEAQLKESYKQACLTLSQLKATHPLLVEVFQLQKKEP